MKCCKGEGCRAWNKKFKTAWFRFYYFLYFFFLLFIFFIYCIVILMSVHPSVHLSVPPNLLSTTPLRPLYRISWNFQELFTTWCHTAPPILSFYSNDFGVSQSKTRTLPYKTWGSGGYHFVSIAHSISSFICYVMKEVM